MTSAERVPHDEYTASLFDRREHAAPKYPTSARPWSKVTGICLHQTACHMGERLERYNTIGAHFVVTRSGKVLWMHGLERLVVHGNGWNNQTVGIEIDGLYAGIEGDQRTVWNNPDTQHREMGMEVTVEAMESARQLVRWIVAEVALRGGKLTKLVAHRQSSDSRRNDPGSAIWKAVALPLHAELGLSDGGVGFKIGSGYAIPSEWDPRCTGIKY